jgi:predicted ATP-dependent serine protease
VDELAALRDVVRLQPGGEASAVVVSGDAGTGKARLLTEALAAADRRRVLHVRGHEAKAPVGLVDEMLDATTDNSSCDHR